MSWIAAVKEWNESRGSWSLPKKGSPEYDEVRKIQERIKSKPAVSEEAEVAKVEKPKRQRNVAEPSLDVRNKRKTKPTEESAGPTAPTKPQPEKKQDVEKSVKAKKDESNVIVMDMDEYRRLTKAPVVKSAKEPLKPTTSEDKAKAKEDKKSKKLELIEVRSQLAKAKVEKNKELVDELNKKVKEIKIALI
jgi:hypothetical protein